MWHRVMGMMIIWSLTVLAVQASVMIGNLMTEYTSTPPNKKATLYLPATSEKGITEGGLPAGKTKGVNFLKMQNGKAVFALGSGSYVFVVGNGTLKPR